MNGRPFALEEGRHIFSFSDHNVYVITGRDAIGMVDVKSLKDGREDSFGVTVMYNQFRPATRQEVEKFKANNNRKNLKKRVESRLMSYSARFVKDVLSEYDLSQQQLANKLGVGRTTIRAIVEGEVVISTFILVGLHSLGVNVQPLIDVMAKDFKNFVSNELKRANIRTLELPDSPPDLPNVQRSRVKQNIPSRSE